MLKQGYLVRASEPTMRTQRMSTKMLGLGIFMVGVMALSIGLIMGLEFPKFVKKKIIDDQCIINTKHQMYDKWRQEKEYTRINHLYYWTIQNEEDFLNDGQIPMLVERGPYVYAEKREKINVKFAVSEVSYQTKVTQKFLADLTHRECGQDCDEDDQLRILNINLLRKLYSHGGLDNFIKQYTPTFIQAKVDDLYRMIRQFDIFDVYDILVCTSVFLECLCTSMSEQHLGNATSISFGQWVAMNDSQHKILFSGERGNMPLNRSQTETLYNFLTNKTIMVEEVPQTCDELWDGIFFPDVSTVSFTTEDSSFSSSDKINAVLYLTEGCGLISAATFLLEKLSVVDSSLVWTLNLCYKDSDDCLSIRDSTKVIISFIVLIKDFILTHVFQEVYKSMMSSDETQLFSRRSQKDLALGHMTKVVAWETSEHYVRGILANHQNVIDAFYNSPKITSSTCLCSRNSDNNMAVREYNGSQFAPPAVCKGTSYLDSVPGSLNYSACVSAKPKRETINLFVEDLHTHFTLTSPTETSYKGNTVFQYSGDKGDSSCKFYDSTNVMKFKSLWSHPKVANNRHCSSVPEILRNISSDTNSVSFIEAEPLTGKIWRKVLTYQIYGALRSVDVSSNYVTSVDNRNYLQKSIPIYRVAKQSDIAESEIEYFNFEIYRLMCVSCGGLIGMTSLAIIVMVTSVFVGLLSSRKNRVAPAAPTETRNDSPS